MKTVTARINWVLLNKKADLFFIGENVMVPFGSAAANALPAALARAGAETVTVEYRTVSDRKAREADQKKFTRRVSELYPHYTRGPWSQKVVDGHTFSDVMVCVLNRTNSEAE